MSVDANIELPLAWITTVYARLQAAGLHGANTLTSMACRAPDCPTAYKRQCLRKLERFPRQDIFGKIKDILWMSSLFVSVTDWLLHT